MIEKQLDRILAADIHSLVDNKVREGKQVEYKELLPTNRDDDKKEFLADVSSFANASGGNLLYGIIEERDENGRATGLPDSATGLSGVNADQELRRLENMIRDGIDPRIPGVQIRAIEGFPSGPVIVLRVPASWASPHMVTFKASPRFFTRTSAGKAPLDVAELRAAFLQSEAVPERIRRFRDDRLGKILAGETPLPLLPGAKMVVHSLPVESFTRSPTIDMRALADNFTTLPSLYSSGAVQRWNLDGLLSFDSSSDQHCVGYAQLFRTGALETADCGLLHPEGDGSKTIPTVAYERELINFLRSLMSFYKGVGVLPPIVVLVSMIGVKNYAMTLSSPFARRGDRNRVDRDVLLLPDVVLEDYDKKPDAVLRPVFDAVGQSAGFPGSPNFDNNGNWIGR